MSNEAWISTVTQAQQLVRRLENVLEIDRGSHVLRALVHSQKAVQELETWKELERMQGREV